MKLNEESLFILILIGQLYTVFMALGYLRNLLSNKKFQLFSFISVIAYIALYQWINIIATVILWAGLCLSIYIIDRNIDIAIFYPSIILFFYIFIDGTAKYLYKILGWDISDFLTAVLGTGCLWIVTVFLKKMVIPKIIRDKTTLKIAAIVVFFTIIVYFINICSDRFSVLARFLVISNELFTVLYGVMSTIIYCVLLFIKKKEFETREQQKEMRHLIEYSEQIENNYLALRKFKHDYKNILFSIEDYIQTKDIEGLQKYFYQSIKATETIFEENNLPIASISNLKIREIKSIILSKLYVASQRGVEVDVMIPTPITDIAISTVTLVRMLGIILDNAIEESAFLEKGKLN
ncbi:GHKL domain-containing protein [Enterococcus hirae]|uniref:GHKL domain-containing protein n=1 Tax=Enterococcus hirae TaxID=1354 RepID=UPI001E523AD9|nr:GHKL domain-containing protein [Enterococcus hirae]MCV3104003.1 GHKL domain-containing protein [Enterococcus hirae]MCV3108924.1 GHKL domain-containing protein [Enterococcus hirae]MCV3111472.1 GHKL domain-containing protein [Enterococcus hirae]MCV3113818.1 GHKL domain-containing protein [Enterococcus hirae]MDT2622909.1 GHKL domain-containing protein [Enterococcus hirae]